MKKLIFVYNGDTGLVNGVMHYLHKRISPKTYPCQLCGVIYDGMSVNSDWLAFVKTLGVPTEFLHRDEYEQRYGESSHAWPAVLLQEDNQSTQVVISATDFSDIGDRASLQSRLAGFVGIPRAAVDATSTA